MAAVGEESGAYVLPGPFHGDAVFAIDTRRLYAAPPLEGIEFRYIPGIGTAHRMHLGGGISVRAGFAFPVRTARE